ncbi:MAG: response regulator transcription factor [Lachnospiraceae bacterium]|nr:response regulator transcription factor [Lachnospiraceae bacterium]
MYNILICDDDRDIVSALKIYLTNPEYRIFEAYNGRDAVETIRREHISLALLDVMMPVMDGLEAMVKIREFSNIPIILLTAKSEDSDKVLGLGVGADDYITKPFHPAEVIARVGAMLRRYTRLGADLRSDSRLVVGGLELDRDSKQVTCEGKPVSLTPKEFDILRLLMENPGKTYSPAKVYREVWGEEPLSGEKTVAVHIRHIREKIEIDPADPRYIKVIFGQGYLLTNS